MTEKTPSVSYRVPTERMLDAARDWSAKAFGKPIGNDAAIGCWQAMFDCSGIAQAEEAMDIVSRAAALLKAKHPDLDKLEHKLTDY